MIDMGVSVDQCRLVTLITLGVPVRAILHRWGVLAAVIALAELDLIATARRAEGTVRCRADPRVS